MVREDVTTEDLGLLFEQRPAVRLGDDRRSGELQRRYLALVMQALRAPAASPLPGPPPGWDWILRRWTVRGMTPDDRQVIRELVENWAVWRDAGDWERFRTVWHDDGRMMATWFQGPADEFIEASREGWDKGVQHPALPRRHVDRRRRRPARSRRPR